MSALTRLRPSVMLWGAYGFVGRDPPEWLVSVIVKLLDFDNRYMIAVEAVALEKHHFGPMDYEFGNYAYMTWDQARASVRRLIDLGIVECGADRMYSWTQIGAHVLDRIPMRDAVLPEQDVQQIMSEAMRQRLAAEPRLEITGLKA